ncbi:hypothetical protein CW703_07360 [Candidatus Bathyarchaeota archaeon]|nr:MAG: hypothetical protein CW703_07360 [Candidatus Bathyarchaeota archaeon]
MLKEIDKLLEFRKISKEKRRKVSFEAKSIFLTNLTCLLILLTLLMVHYIQYQQFEPTILGFLLMLIGHLSGMIVRSKT